MDTFTWFFTVIGIIVLIVMANPYFSWWGKSLAVIYYGIISFFFIGITHRMHEKYSGITPVPDAYWDENSQWAETASHLFLLPFIGVLIFVYINWFINARTILAKKLNCPQSVAGSPAGFSLLFYLQFRLWLSAIKKQQIFTKTFPFFETFW